MNPADRTNPVVTIAVACLATAMLMLDISVINTALSEIASGLDTDLGGNAQAYVDGLHHALIVCTVFALACAAATAWLLIPARARDEGEVVTETV
jgi:hypothetical protein